MEIIDRGDEEKPNVSMTPPGWTDESTFEKPPVFQVPGMAQNEDEERVPLSDNQTLSLESQNYGRGLPEDWEKSPEEKWNGIKETLVNHSLNPQEDYEKAVSSHYIASMLSLDPNDVFLNYESSVNQYFQDTLAPKTAFGAITDEAERATKSIQLGHAGSMLMLDPTSEYYQNKVKKIIASMPKMDNVKRWLPVETMKAVAGIAPSIGASMGAGLATSAALSAALGPEAGPAGFVIGSGLEAYTIASGNIFVDILETRDPVTGKPLIDVIDNPEYFMKMAQAASAGGGLLSAAIEVVQLDKLTGGKVLQGAINKSVSKSLREYLIKGNMRQMFQAFLLEHGKMVGTEVLQELAQESIEMAASDLVLRVENEIEDLDIPTATFEEWKTTMLETAKQTGLGVGVIGIGGSISNMSSGFKSLQAQEQQRIGGGAEYFTVDDATKAALLEDIKLSGFESEGDIDREVTRLEGVKGKLTGRLDPVDVYEAGSGQYVPAANSGATVAALKKLESGTAAINVITPSMPEMENIQQNNETADLTTGQFHSYLSTMASSTQAALQVKTNKLKEGADPQTDSALTGSLIYKDHQVLSVAIEAIKKEMPVFNVKVDPKNQEITLKAQMPNGYLTNIRMMTEEIWVREEKINPIAKKLENVLIGSGLESEADSIREILEDPQADKNDITEVLSEVSAGLDENGSYDFDEIKTQVDNSINQVNKDYSSSLAVMQGEKNPEDKTAGKPQENYEMTIEEWANSKENEKKTKIAHEIGQEEVNRDVLKQAFEKFFPDWNDDQVNTSLALADSIAKYKGITTSDWLRMNISPAIFSRGKDLFGNKAAIEFMEDSRAIIHLSDDSDFSSWVHELGHILRVNLTPEDLKTVESELKVKNNNWTTAKEEDFVSLMEDYFLFGEFPEKAEGFLKKAYQFLHDIYNKLSQYENVPRVIRDMFDKIFLDNSPGVPVVNDGKKVSGSDKIYQPREKDKQGILYQSTGKSSIIKDEELEHIGVAYGSKERYQKAWREALERFVRLSKTTPRQFLDHDGQRLKQHTNLIPFEKIKRIDITGKRVGNYNELAALLSHFRNPRIEIANIIYMDNKNNILAHTAFTSGLPAKSIGLEYYDRYKSMTKIKHTAKKLGATNVLFSHNHPSGDPKSSKDDRDLTWSYRQELGELFGGHIIIDHDKYNYLDPVYPDNDNFAPLEKKGKDFNKNINNKIRLTGQFHVASVFKKLLSQPFVTVFAGLNNQWEITSWTYADMEVYSGSLGYKNLLRKMGGRAAVLITNDKDRFKREIYNQKKKA